MTMWHFKNSNDFCVDRGASVANDLYGVKLPIFVIAHTYSMNH